MNGGGREGADDCRGRAAGKAFILPVLGGTLARPGHGRAGSGVSGAERGEDVTKGLVTIRGGAVRGALAGEDRERLGAEPAAALNCLRALWAPRRHIAGWPDMGGPARRWKLIVSHGNEWAVGGAKMVKEEY